MIYKNGNAFMTGTGDIIKNLYTGSQANVANARLVYNYNTDIFKNYGFNTCLRLEPTRTADGTTKFLTYSYLLTTNIVSDPQAEYIFSMYAYNSPDCNADLRMHLENSCTWITNHQNTTGNIVETRKGQVIHFWGKFRPNPSNGGIWLMFYPSPNNIDGFVRGYQLFAGITIYKGTKLITPSTDYITHGFYSAENTKSIYTDHMVFNDFIEN